MRDAAVQHSHGQHVSPRVTYIWAWASPNQFWRRNPARPTRNDSVSPSASVSVPTDIFPAAGTPLSGASAAHSSERSTRLIHGGTSTVFTVARGLHARTPSSPTTTSDELTCNAAHGGARARPRPLRAYYVQLTVGGRASDCADNDNKYFEQRQRVHSYGDSSSTVARGGDEGLGRATTAW